MADIVLATLNARYAHCAFGLRYLLANLGDLQPRACLLEFDISQRPLDVAEAILAHQPRLLGLGVYLWNADPSRQLVALLKRLRPNLVIILGGPEVSYEPDDQEICRLANYTLRGEADLAFAQLCRELLASPPGVASAVPADSPPPEGCPALSSARGGEGGMLVTGSDRGNQPSGGGDAGAPADRRVGTRDATPPATGAGSVLSAPLPDLAAIALPYDLYTADDLAHRVIYVEASRGCPFECEFCLSSLDIPVRRFPLDQFLAAMQRLLDRGARGFKFVDRTFNLDLNTSAAILEFFLARDRPGLALHFEMIPDRFPDALRGLVARFPPGRVQFEVGIQTFNEAVAARISRRQDNAQATANLRWLRDHTGVHIHADLIFGLPGETLASMADSFDRLVALRPHVIQVGILKRLRGTPIVRHDADWQMLYSPHPPYEILANRLIDFPTMQRLKRFARYWDLVANSGRFPTTAPLLWHPAGNPSLFPDDRPEIVNIPDRGGPAVDTAGRGTAAAPFAGFLGFADWLYAATNQTHAIALPRLARLLHRYLVEQPGFGSEQVQSALDHDASAFHARTPRPKG